MPGCCTGGVSSQQEPPPRPFRWSLSARADGGPDRIGGLGEGAEPVELWYLDELVRCTALVLARSAAADLVLVGRSLDSVYDLLTGAYERTSRADGTALRRLPLSGLSPWTIDGTNRRRLREHLAAVGLEPSALARRGRPVALVDIVHGGGTFDALHGELARWIEESRQPWPVIRRRLRYVGVTIQGSTSPKHLRWQQSEPSWRWVRTLPSGHVVNVSMPFEVWSWFGNGHQPKIGPAFPPARWFDGDAAGVPRHERLPDALAHARALVEAGRGRAVRDQLVRVMAADPGFAAREVRALASELRHRAG